MSCLARSRFRRLVALVLPCALALGAAACSPDPSADSFNITTLLPTGKTSPTPSSSAGTLTSPSSGPTPTPDPNNAPPIPVSPAPQGAGSSPTSPPSATTAPAGALTVSGFTPIQGIAGTQVTITGSNFATNPNADFVRFNGFQAVVTSASANQLVVTVPTGATTGPVTVSIANTIASSVNNFTVLPGQPQITGFSPTSGPPGTPVTITGVNLGASVSDDLVTFQGVTGTVTAAASNAAIAIVPPAAITGSLLLTVDGLPCPVGTFTVTVGNPAPSPSPVTTLAGSNTAPPGFTNGQGAAAQFSTPEDAAVNPNTGVVYVADTGNNAIRAIQPNGTVSTLAGNGTAGASNGVGSAATFSAPTALVCAPSGMLYVADSGNSLIRQVAPDGTTTTLAGSTTGAQDGSGSGAQFNQPQGLALDASGVLYVADTGNDTIRTVTISNGVGTVATIAGSAGVAGSQDAQGTSARFSSPHGIAWYNGNLFIADTANLKIRMLTLGSNVVTTIAGSSQGYSESSNGLTAQFNQPWGLAADPKGNLYVADYYNHVIRKLVGAGGSWSTQLFTGLPNNPSWQDGTLANALFANPAGLSFGNGVLVVADPTNKNVREIRLP